MTRAKNKLTLTNNIKFELNIDDKTLQIARKIRETYRLENKTILVAGSTHELEEDMLIQAFKQIKLHFKEVLLIIVPRHPQRFEKVVSIITNHKIEFVKFSRRNLY